MKTKKNRKKLVLSKTTIVDLNKKQLDEIRGGITITPLTPRYATLYTCDTDCGQYTCYSGCVDINCHYR